MEKTLAKVLLSIKNDQTMIRSWKRAR